MNIGNNLYSKYIKISLKFELFHLELDKKGFSLVFQGKIEKFWVSINFLRIQSDFNESF